MRAQFTTITILLFSTVTLSQTQVGGSRCPLLINSGINIFIAGYRDTIQPNGQTARIINVASLVKGFDLLCSDTSLTIRGYRLAFFDSKGTLYSKSTVNYKTLDDEQNIVPLQNIKEATFITIDNIMVEYKGACYMIQPQLYYAQ